ncbi:hypothetical protein SAMN05216284_1331, partial [Micromonospora sediminimaris]
MPRSIGVRQREKRSPERASGTTTSQVPAPRRATGCRCLTCRLPLTEPGGAAPEGVWRGPGRGQAVAVQVTVGVFV